MKLKNFIRLISNFFYTALENPSFFLAKSGRLKEVEGNEVAFNDELPRFLAKKNREIIIN